MKIVTPNLRYKNDKLHFENVELEKVVKKFSTPLYIYSKNQIIENFLRYKKAFDNRNFIICYAMKANSNRKILEVIGQLSGGCDITSGGELYRALRAKIPSNKIVYAGVGKTIQEIEFAIKNKILMFNVESKEELDLINTIASKKSIKIKVTLRINPEVQTHTISHISTGEEGTKFGIPIGEAISYVRYLKENCKSLDLVGFHYHIGSQICILNPFVEAARKIKKLIDEIKHLGFYIKYVNIGGGLGVVYNNENPPTPKQLISCILKILPKDCTIICEPGRSIVGNAGILVTKVLFTKNVKNKNFLVVDASMTDLIRPAFYEAYHNILPLIVYKQDRKCTEKIYDVVGPVCETSDFLGKNRCLPVVNNGDFLVIETAGAYGFAMSSNYNSRLKSAEVIVDKDDFYLVTEREKYYDLVRKEL
ncbi:MAG: diaminopimelate decarboxylase [Endomicrobia bacterium]|nr:diaminopimelate decarboxylase [Endomicrobiia bacterium]